MLLHARTKPLLGVTAVVAGSRMVPLQERHFDHNEPPGPEYAMNFRKDALRVIHVFKNGLRDHRVTGPTLQREILCDPDDVHAGEVVDIEVDDVHAVICSSRTYVRDHGIAWERGHEIRYEAPPRGRLVCQVRLQAVAILLCQAAKTSRDELKCTGIPLFRASRASAGEKEQWNAANNPVLHVA